MNVLIVGYGSIGKRHFEVLNSFPNIRTIDLVTKQIVNDVLTYENIMKVPDIHKYDYFVISSETIKHYEQLKYICSKVDDKKILVEKPLYDKKHKNIECNNFIFTAYNLRFHPIFIKLKELLFKEKIYYVNIICGQYLPTWRVERDYRESYSSNINLGGGVLRDLSHELDYINWLFGDIDKIDYINTKISDLEITSDDIFTAIAVTNKRIIINLTVDYISKIAMRRLMIHTSKSTLEVDVIQNRLLVYGKDGEVENIEIEQISRNQTYLSMHSAILNNNFEMLSNFYEGQKVVNIINNITFKEW